MKIDLGFSVVFMLECAIKVIAMGFIVHDNSYLRDSWNCLDFLIVVISIVGLLPMGGGGSSVKVLRTFRILRPLRSVNKLPAVRLQIKAILNALPNIYRDFIFIIFIFSIFAIFGTNQFKG